MVHAGKFESRGDRAAMAADAGVGPISLTSVAAGLLVAYGAFLIIGAIVGSVVNAIGIDVNVSSTDYEQLAIVGGLIAAGVLFLSYLFGGYVAGRMARRRGVLHGVLVLVLGIAVVLALAAVTSAADNTQSLRDALGNLGVPTTAAQYGNALSVAGIAALVAVVIGSLLGGQLGERWHGKLLTRALDPEIGAEAEARERAQQEAARADEHHTQSVERVRRTSPLRRSLRQSPAEPTVVTGVPPADLRPKLYRATSRPYWVS